MTSAIETAVRRVGMSDLAAVRELIDQDPVSNVFVAARLAYACRSGSLDSFRLGGELLVYAPRGRPRSLCYVDGNLVPIAADEEAIDAFGHRLMRRARQSASLVGEAEAVLSLWDFLEPTWGPAREVRPCQPVLAIPGPPRVRSDPAVRPVRTDELDLLFPAAVAMFTEEVGVSPLADGGAGYRARLQELILGGHAFARFEDRSDGPAVIFKADVGYATPEACQVQGVWVAPHLRGQGLSVGAMARVVELAQRDIAPTVSLYVNDYNHIARALYQRVGFHQVSTFATVLL